MNLFDIIDGKVPPPLPKKEDIVCQHPEKSLVKTTTVWPGEAFERLTWTCKVCNLVMGRA